MEKVKAPGIHQAGRASGTCFFPGRSAAVQPSQLPLSLSDYRFLTSRKILFSSIIDDQRVWFLKLKKETSCSCMEALTRCDKDVVLIYHSGAELRIRRFCIQHSTCTHGNRNPVPISLYKPHVDPSIPGLICFEPIKTQPLVTLVASDGVATCQYTWLWD